MKRIVLCFDGTWNAITSPNLVTNVVKFANALTIRAKDGTHQIAYYNSGVGSGGPLDRFLGGAFGAGLKSNVKRGLLFLALNYNEGDQIYLFGFSRGAYTARALAGVLSVAGIPLEIRGFESHWNYYQRYSKLRIQLREAKGNPQRREAIKKELDLLSQALNSEARYHGAELPIMCVGVWDTVGAYGVPVSFGLSALPRLFTYWTRGFRDTDIGPMVRHGFHALAIDEMRRPFNPTLWTLRTDKEQAKDAEQAPNVEQMWFPGVHSNVGGGYDSSGLSDLALAWMIARVGEKTGLEFNEEYIFNNIWPCPASTLYRTGHGKLFSRVRSVLPAASKSAVARFIDGIKRAIRKREYIPRIRINEQVHWSVLQRRDCPGAIVDGEGVLKYAPANLPHTLDHCSPQLDLERALMSSNRDWAKDLHCPLTQLNMACACHGTSQQAPTAGDGQRAQS